MRLKIKALRKDFPYVFFIFGVIFFSGCRSEIERAKACYRLGDFPRAQLLFDKAIEENPQSFEARYGYALSLQELALHKKERGEDLVTDWREVAAAYEFCSKLGKIKSLSENYSFALFHYAHKLYLENDLSSSLFVLEKARRIDPRNTFCLNLSGVLQFALGKYGDAETTFEILLALDPKFETAYLNLGNVFWEDNQEDAAMVTWQQGLERNPNDTALVSRLQSAVTATTGF